MLASNEQFKINSYSKKSRTGMQNYLEKVTSIKKTIRISAWET